MSWWNPFSWFSPGKLAAKRAVRTEEKITVAKIKDVEPLSTRWLNGLRSYCGVGTVSRWMIPQGVRLVKKIAAAGIAVVGVAAGGGLIRLGTPPPEPPPSQVAGTPSGQGGGAVTIPTGKGGGGALTVPSGKGGGVPTPSRQGGGVVAPPSGGGGGIVNTMISILRPKPLPDISPQPFELTVSNSGDVSVVQGQSAQNTITATLSLPRNTSFSASGLPPDATATFSPNSCSRTCTTTLTIATQGTTPAGNSTVTVSAVAGTVTETTPFKLMVTQLLVKQPLGPPVPPPPPPPGPPVPPPQEPPTGPNCWNPANWLVCVDWPPKPPQLPPPGPPLPPGPPPPFDFTVANSGGVSVVQGQSAQNTITATLLSSASRNTRFSASGLPSNVTATFSPSSCALNCTTTLTISTQGTTPAGNSTITVNAVAGTVTKTTPFNLTINKAPSRPTPLPAVAIPVSVKLSLQSGIQRGAKGSNRIPVHRRNPAYTVEKLLLSPAIYLDVTFSDGSKVGPHDYHKNNARDVIFAVCRDKQLSQCIGDGTNDDPNALIKVVYRDVDRKNPKLGKFAAQVTSTENDAGTAYLKVSLRDYPKISDSVEVEVVSTSEPEPLQPPEPTPAPIPYGALALDLTTPLPTGLRYGLSHNQDSGGAASKSAIKKCGSENCKIAQSFSGLGCAAYVSSIDTGRIVWSWGTAPNQKRAQDEGEKQCRKDGGTNCKVVETACNTAVEISRGEISR